MTDGSMSVSEASEDAGMSSEAVEDNPDALTNKKILLERVGFFCGWKRWICPALTFSFRHRPPL